MTLNDIIYVLFEMAYPWVYRGSQTEHFLNNLGHFTI